MTSTGVRGETRLEERLDTRDSGRRKGQDGEVRGASVGHSRVFPENEEGCVTCTTLEGG